MFTIDIWAKKWNVPQEAINDLKQQLRIDNDKQRLSIEKTDEAQVQNKVRLEATKKGCRLWRNNIGATKQNNSYVRYGLANDSTAVNKFIKSADLIGIRPVTVTLAMVGTTIGQFISREIKHSAWKYSDNERERAQLRWIELVISLGGDACFATSEGTL